MNKTTKIIIAVVAIIVVIAIAVALVLANSKPQSNLEINSEEDLVALVDKIYEGQTIEMPSLMTQKVDITDESAVQYVTGLENAQDLEFVVTSEPMMTSQAYSLVLVKVKDGVNANQIAKTMNENVNPSKWICVTAESVYTTSSGNVICLVMSSEKVAKPIYEKFKTLVGSVGEEYVRIQQEAELPPEMY